MSNLSTRLPHIVTRQDMVALLTTTYGVAQAVEDDEAQDRLTRALADRALMDDLLASMAQAFASYVGPNTDENALLDKLSKRVATRRASTPAIRCRLGARLQPRHFTAAAAKNHWPINALSLSAIPVALFIGICRVTTTCW